MMSSKWLCRVLVAGALVLLAQQAVPCSFATGYFHQITHLRGKVVGMTNYWPMLGYKSYPPWLRHSVARERVRLRLYQYCWPIRTDSERPLVKAVTTNEDGKFDFGVVPVGHYTLLIDWPAESSESFDVEIRKLPAETSSVKIDVSPVDPDCSGGHEFIVYSK
jgi:hypothetical protein